MGQSHMGGTQKSNKFPRLLLALALFLRHPKGILEKQLNLVLQLQQILLQSGKTTLVLSQIQIVLYLTNL